MTVYADVRTEVAYLNTRHGIRLAEIFFGFNADILEALCGRYSRGKRTGQLRGAVYYKRAVRGGWVRENGYGHVQFPGIVEGSIYIGDAFTGRPI